MNIAIFPSAFYPSLGGVEELVRQLALELRRRDHSVIILTNRWPRRLPRTGVLDEIPIYRFSFRVPGGGWKQEVSYRLTHSLVHLETQEILRRHRIEVIHVQCVSCNALYALEASARLKLPLVVTLQGELTMDQNRIFDSSPIAKTLLQRSLNEANAVTGCSAKTIRDAELFVGRSLPEAKVIFNASRQEDFVDVENWFHSRPYILALGRLVPQKGFDLLIEAFALAGITTHDLLIAGDGPEQKSLESMAKKLSVGGCIHFLGRVDRKQVAALFRGASFFVLPSRADEGLPVVCAEGMAAGKAVVASRSGGAPEIVIDGVTGILVDKEDVQALATGMRQLCDFPKRAQAFGQAGLRRSVEFSWSRVADEYLGVYKRLIRTHGGDRSRSTD